MAEPKKVKIILNDIKKPLKKQTALLIAGLKEHGHSISLKDRVKYERAILAMTLAHVVLKKISCVPTDMSLEMPPPSPSARRAKARKRSRTR